jgi:hypothetical protein
LAEEIDELKRAAKARALVLADEGDREVITTTTTTRRKKTQKTEKELVVKTAANQTNMTGIAILSAIAVVVTGYLWSKRK